MKRALLIGAIACAMLSACATTGQPVDISTTKLSVATHADLQAAAAYANAHGYAPVAAVYLADEGRLTAVEAQISACANAIAAALPAPPAQSGTVGPITAFEMAREAVGSLTGIPASVKIICEPLPIPLMPLLPKP